MAPGNFQLSATRSFLYSENVQPKGRRVFYESIPSRIPCNDSSNVELARAGVRGGKRCRERAANADVTAEAYGVRFRFRDRRAAIAAVWRAEAGRRSQETGQPACGADVDEAGCCFAEGRLHRGAHARGRRTPG